MKCPAAASSAMGEDYDVAHVPEQAQAVLKDYERRSAHYDVLDRRPQPPPSPGDPA